MRLDRTGAAQFKLEIGALACCWIKVQHGRRLHPALQRKCHPGSGRIRERFAQIALKRQSYFLRRTAGKRNSKQVRIDSGSQCDVKPVRRGANPLDHAVRARG